MESYLSFGSRIKSQKKRYLVLQGKTLVVYKSEKEFKSKKTPKQEINIFGYKCSRFDPPKKKKKNVKFYFKLEHFLSGNIFFSTEDHSIGAKWVECLKSYNPKSSNKTVSSVVTKPEKLPSVQSNPKLLDDLEGIEFLKSSYFFSNQAKENKIFHLQSLIYNDSMNFISEEYFCILTLNKLLLKPFSVSSENQLTIEYSKIERIRFISDTDQNYKLVLKKTNRTPIFIISDNPFSIIMFYLCLNFLKEPKISSYINYGPIKTHENINQIFHPLLKKMFQIIVEMKKDFSVLGYEKIKTEQNLWIQKIEEYFSQQNIFQIIENSSTDPQSLQCLVSILCYIFWLLPDPIFQFDHENFEELYEPSNEKAENNIKRFLKNFDSCKPMIKEIISCSFLMIHLIWKEIDYPILRNLSQFTSTLIHFVKMDQSLETEVLLNISQRHFSYIAFIISNAPVLFYDKWDVMKNIIMGREFVIKEEYKNLVKELFEINETEKEIIKESEKEIEKEKENNKLKENQKEEKQNENKNIQKVNKILSNESINTTQKDNQTTTSSPSTSINNEESSANLNQNLETSSVTSNQSRTKENIIEDQAIQTKAYQEEEPGSDIEDQNEEETVIKSLHEYFDKPLPLLPISETGLSEMYTLPHISEQQTNQIMDLFTSNFNILNNSEALLASLLSNEVVENPKQLIEQILDVYCYEFHAVGLDICQDYSEFEYLTEKMIDKCIETKPVNAPLLVQLNIPLTKTKKDKDISFILTKENEKKKTHGTHGKFFKKIRSNKKIKKKIKKKK
ncbi:sesquipedalian [Anaeramoeba flamelloides]|uniref:Sesquipedalian n=1 Tax=Anaeramoeba flamelloides TaxID=1746091 RepID=A0ABQ8XXI1_9EUKA|nr:sesquipedalian [Anaeramoeba flamelloides]